MQTIPDTAALRRALGRAALLALLAAATLACGGMGEGEGRPVRVHIPRGAAMSEVADSLAAHDIVDAAFAFRVYARLKGVAGSIKAGTYEFRPGAGWDRVLDDLEHGRVVHDRLVIPEGWDIRRIAPGLAAAADVPVDSVQAMLFDSTAADRFQVPGPTLEGYLFPATYAFPVRAPLDSLVRRIVERYRAVWTPERRARADSIDMTEREVVTLASIIEAEAKHPAEMPLISAVYHNRLRRNYPLQADPTVQYALGAHQQRLLYAHIDSSEDNPYNTYRRPGLPPGPIGSPGEAAIDAALRPDSVSYFYFVARPDGSHVFTRTYAEHQRAVAAMRRARAARERANEAATTAEPR
ncbi:MAG TPA: endolytic transglycosylase MltG [Longimicrobiales bacterium]|nr:endolytic transglycosylase MltG [Longimicrobiales bacterium]